MTESFENFLLMISPAKRQRLLCLGGVRELSSVTAEYGECHLCTRVEDALLLHRSEETFDLICVPRGVGASGQFWAELSLTGFLSQLSGLLSEGGRLVVCLDSKAPKLLVQLIVFRYWGHRLFRDVRAVRLHAAYPSGSNPHLSSCWEPQSLKWFFAHSYPKPRSWSKKLFYNLSARLRMGVLFVPGYIVEIEK